MTSAARAGLVRIVLQGQKCADGVDLESEFARVADEREPAHVACLVATTIAIGARRRRQKADLFVIADGRNLHAAAPAASPIETLCITICSSSH